MQDFLKIEYKSLSYQPTTFASYITYTSVIDKIEFRMSFFIKVFYNDIFINFKLNWRFSLQVNSN